MALEKTKYEYGNSTVRMTHCPFCTARLCGNGWSYHIEQKPECREAALNGLESMASGGDGGDTKSYQGGRDTVQSTL